MSDTPKRCVHGTMPEEACAHCARQAETARRVSDTPKPVRDTYTEGEPLMCATCGNEQEKHPGQCQHCGGHRTAPHGYSLRHGFSPCPVCSPVPALPSVEQARERVESEMCDSPHCREERDKTIRALGEGVEGLDFEAAQKAYDASHDGSDYDNALDRQHRVRLGALQQRVRELEKDAARWRWLVRTFTAAKGGATLTMNDDLAVYQTPEPGKECRIQWYPDTPVGFYVSEAATMDAAIDYAMQPEVAP